MKIHETQKWPYPLSTRENHLWDSQIRGSILNGVCLIMGYDGPSQNCNFKRDKDFSTKVFFPWSVRCPSGHRGCSSSISSVRPHITRQRHIEHLSPIARGTAGDGNVGSLCRSADHVWSTCLVWKKLNNPGLILGCLDWLDWVSGKT